MALLLHIDTATSYAGVCISRDQDVIAIRESAEQKNHAAFLQPAIEQMLQETGIVMQDLDAVSVAAGPGSYTGLRVGLASAKGICYAAGKPLIPVNTLQIIAAAAMHSPEAAGREEQLLYCPMIDARRMEVFAAVYNHLLEEVVPPAAFILNNESFSSLLAEKQVLFSGDGHFKFKEISGSSNAIFTDITHSVRNLALIAGNRFGLQQFADLAYSEPFYIKEFFDPAAR
ncbi:tRNA (adenosine(37)-N6)-threonylcarbamoyltransferase complex dimerization subunit type 1 TsaB [Sediminibacterium ginsengisoli]|uniref:tRNA threonylcarbamoyladenosine biosynthesis protein TsaB n=1 Tax=Sediminibacterium ginsengisoli TaxID=413434 RepID=A0A1T4LVM5_9BACT|nr:tRNA (adenosine(37)-N6)-threonylcarbamoyltransferase complex dimerization subunit type 1 TsaB [Sediminibacterium ginsengisoli]SJZ58790.1 tRNA threonylcarbamoyladenosine biosynthesis protein TsaB [Sediminibacterium ginsengisoli]